MAKNDNTKQIIFNIKDALVDEDDEGKVILTNDVIENIKVEDIFRQYLGQPIDLNVGGAVRISPDSFHTEDF